MKFNSTKKIVIEATLGFIMLFLILLLQHRLWRGDGGITQVRKYQTQLSTLKKEVKENQERNDALYADVINLRNSTEALEERARHELGMIKSNETFFQIIE